MIIAHDPLNIIISGVGGQGNILVSHLISRSFCEEGFFVSVGETYGATQRGGSVVSHIRLSLRHPYGPLIPVGNTHIIVGFEPLEVYRILRDYGHHMVRVVMNNRPFYPLDALRKKSPYPPMEDLLSHIKNLANQVKVIKGTQLAREAGNTQAQNIVMLGAFVGLNWVPIGKEKYLSAIEEIFSGTNLDINRKAFELGFRATLE